MGVNSSSSRHSVLDLGAGDITCRQSGSVARAKRRSTLKQSYRSHNAPGVSGNAHTGESTPCTTALLVAVDALSTRRQHRDGAEEDTALSGTVQSTRLTSPNCLAQENRPRVVPSPMIMNMRPSLRGAVAVAPIVTNSQRSSSGSNDRCRGAQEEAHVALVYQLPQEREETCVRDGAGTGISYACSHHGGNDNVDVVTLQSGSLTGVDQARPLLEQLTTDSSTLSLSHTAPLPLKDVSIVAEGEEPAPVLVSDQTLVPDSLRSGGEGLDNVDVRIAAPKSLPVSDAVLPLTSTSRGETLPGLPGVSFSPSTNGALLPYQVSGGREACFTGSRQCLPVAVHAAIPQWAEGRFDGDVEIIAGCCCHSERILVSTFKAQGTSESGHHIICGDEGVWSQPLRAILHRRLPSRRGPTAVSPLSLPARLDRSEEESSDCVATLKLTSEEGLCCITESAMRVLNKEASAASHPQRLSPSASSLAASGVCGMPCASSIASPCFHVAAAAVASPTSSLAAQRVFDSQTLLVEEYAAECTTLAMGVGSRHNSTNGVRRVHDAECESGSGIDRVKCGDEQQPNMQLPQEAIHPRNLLSPAQMSREDSETGSSSMTSSDTSSQSILAPPPSIHLSDLLCSRVRATASATSSTNTRLSYGLEDGIRDDDASPRALNTHHYHQRQLPLKAPCAPEAGVVNLSTVTNTTTRMSSQWPFVCSLAATASAESDSSTATTSVASSAAAVPAARPKGQRWVSRSAIIAAWSRMTVCAEGTVSSSGVLRTSAVPPNRATSLHRAQAAAVEKGTAEGSAHSAPSAAVLPVRRGCVAAYSGAPPLVFRRSSEEVQPSEAARKTVCASIFLSIQVDTPVKTRSASESASLPATDGINDSPPTSSTQGPLGEPAPRGEGAEVPFTGGLLLSPREVPFVLDAPTIDSPVAASPSLSSPRIRGINASVSALHSPRERMVVSTDFSDSDGQGSLGKKQHTPARPSMASGEEIASETATTVDADEGDCIHGEGTAAGVPRMRRGCQPCLRDQFRVRSLDTYSLRLHTSEFATTHTTVGATSGLTGLLPSHTQNQHCCPHLGREAHDSPFASSPCSEGSFGIRAFSHKRSSVSMRMCVPGRGSLEREGSEARVREDSFGGVDARHTQDAGAARGPRNRVGSHFSTLFAGRDASPNHYRRILFAPFRTPQSETLTSDTVEALVHGTGGLEEAPLEGSSRYQPPCPPGRPTQAHDMSSSFSVARLMPRREGRLSPPTPRSTSQVSLDALRDEVRCAVTHSVLAPWSEGGFGALNIRPPTQGSRTLLHQRPHPPQSASLLHAALHQRRYASDVEGSVQWQEVGLHASSTQTSQNFDFARNNEETEAEGSSRDNARRRTLCPWMGSAGEDSHNESDGVSGWGMATPRIWQSGRDEDISYGDDDGGSEEEVGSNTSGSDVVGCSSVVYCRANRRCMGSLHCHDRRLLRSLPSASTLSATHHHPLPYRSYRMTNVSRDSGPFVAADEDMPHSCICPCSMNECRSCFSPPRYEPPMPSNRNTFTAFVPLADISPSQLLYPSATGPPCAQDVYLPGLSPVTRGGKEGAAAVRGDSDAENSTVLWVNTPNTSDTLIVKDCEPDDASLAISASAGEASTLLISSPPSSLSISPTQRISKSTTFAPAAVPAAALTQTLQSPVHWAVRRRSEVSGSLSGGIPCKSRPGTKALTGLSHLVGAVSVASGGDGSSGDMDSDDGADDLPLRVAPPTPASLRASWGSDSMGVACAPFYEGERHMFSDDRRPKPDVPLHTIPCRHDHHHNHDHDHTLGVPLASRTAEDNFGQEAAQGSASQLLLAEQWSKPQPWWNQSRRVARPRVSGTVAIARNPGNKINGNRRDFLSSRQTKNALATVLGDRVAFSPSRRGTISVTSSPSSDMLHLGGRAVVTVEAGTSGGRLPLTSQYSTIVTSDCGSNGSRESSSCANSDVREYTARGGAAGSVVHDSPSGEMVIGQVCACSVEDRSADECIGKKLLFEVVAIKPSVTLTEDCPQGNPDGDNVRYPPKCTSPQSPHRQVSLAPSFSCFPTTAPTTEVAGAGSKNKTGVLLASLPPVTSTVTVSPSAELLLAEPEGIFAHRAVPHAFFSLSGTGGSSDDPSAITCVTDERRESGVDWSRSSGVDTATTPLRGAQNRADSCDGHIPSTLSDQSFSAVLHLLGETETTARLCIEESVTSVREAWVAMWDSFLLQGHHRPLLPKQGSFIAAPVLPRPSTISEKGVITLSTSNTTLVVQRGAQGEGVDTAASNSGIAEPSVRSPFMDDCVTGMIGVNLSCSNGESPPVVVPGDIPQIGDSPGVAVTLAAPSFDVKRADLTRHTEGADVGSGDLDSGQSSPYANGALEAVHGVSSLFTTSFTGSSHATAPLVAHSYSVRNRCDPLKGDVAHLDTSLRKPTCLSTQCPSLQPDHSVASCAAGPPLSPNHVFDHKPLYMYGEDAAYTLSNGRGDTPPTSNYGLVVPVLSMYEGSTPHLRGHSDLHRQHRIPRVDRTTCRWCGGPHTSVAVCPVALRPHSELRKERRREKMAKRAAQKLLFDGRISEAVSLLRNSGVCPP